MTDSVSTSSPIFLKLRKWGLPFVLCLSAVLAALLAPLYYPGEFQDDVAYVAVSRAMVEGKGYTTLFSVTGGLESKYPPGYPLLMAPIQALFPHSLDLLRLETALMGLGAVALVWFRFPKFGPFAALLTGLNPFWCFYQGTLMSDIPFAFFFLAFFGKMEQLSDASELTRRDRLELAITMACAFYVRSVGLVLMVTYFLVLWLWKIKRRESIFVLVWTVLLCLPAIMTSQAFSGYRGDLDNYPGVFQVAQENFISNFQALLPLLWGQPMAFSKLGLGGTAMLAWGFTIATCLLILMGAVSLVRQRRYSIPILFVLWTLLFAVWPAHYPRFLLPLLPLFYTSLLEGVESLNDSSKSAWKLASALVGLFFLLEILSARTALAVPARVPPAMIRWVESNCGKHDAIYSTTSDIWLHTGRQILYEPANMVWQDPERWVWNLHEYGVRWVVLPTSEARAISILDAIPEEFQRTFEDEHSHLVVYKVVGDPHKFRLAVLRAQTGILKEMQGHSGNADLERSLQLAPWLLAPRLFWSQKALMEGHPEEAAKQVAVLKARFAQVPKVLQLEQHLPPATPLSP